MKLLLPLNEGFKNCENNFARYSRVFNDHASNEVFHVPFLYTCTLFWEWYNIYLHVHILLINFCFVLKENTYWLY